MFDVLRFWLRKGVDGFRVDVMWMMIKDDQFRDNPPNPRLATRPAPSTTGIPLYTANRPEVHEVVAEMRAVLDEFADRVLIGELYLPIEQLVTYYGDDGRGAQLPFNFQLLLLQDWSAAAIAGADHAATRRRCRRAPGRTGCSATMTAPASPRRIGPAQARIAAMLLLTLRGTPTIYMGEELGMQDTPIPQSRGPRPGRAAPARQRPGPRPRAHARSPGPTDPAPASPPASPGCRIGADTPLSRQRDDPASMVSLYRRLIALRRAHPALAIGAITEVAAHGPVLTYRRELDGQAFHVALNTSSTEAEAALPAGAIIADTHAGPAPGRLTLQPNQELVIQL